MRYPIFDLRPAKDKQLVNMYSRAMHGLKRIKEEFTKRLPTPQQFAELYKEAGIANGEDYQQAKGEILAYRNRLNLEGFPELPVVQETLNSLTTESQ